MGARDERVTSSPQGVVMSLLRARLIYIGTGAAAAIPMDI